MLGSVRSGQRAHSLLSGEFMTFRRTSSETGGELIELDLELRPLGAPAGLPHRHLVAERFELVGGRLWVWVQGRRPWIAYPGDTIEVPPARWHFVLALQRSKAKVTIRPGVQFDELLVRWAALGSGDIKLEHLRRILPLLRLHGCI
jgi:mannose-6-phosphate isomerase-like protein (cupin superfamily)